MKLPIIFLFLTSYSSCMEDKSKALIPYQSDERIILNSFCDNVDATLARCNDLALVLDERRTELEKFSPSDLQRLITVASLVGGAYGTSQTIRQYRTTRSLTTSAGLIVGLGSLIVLGGNSIYGKIKEWVLQNALTKIEKRLLSVEEEFDVIKLLLDRVKERESVMGEQIDESGKKIDRLIAAVQTRLRQIKPPVVEKKKKSRFWSKR